jgi:energy-coupling factor transporter ATP-binding protein EcfA2
VASEQADYVVTVDALTKMLDILQRVTCGQPAVIMGDTGCGKSALVQQLCALVQAPLRTLNMHGGMDEADVASWLRRTLAECAALRPWLHDGLFFIFLDEVNTCDCLGLVKEVTCDRMLDGTPLPAHVAIVAACNPYRCRHPCSSGPIAMEDLVYVFAARGVLVVTCSCPPPTSLCNACSP